MPIPPLEPIVRFNEKWKTSTEHSYNDDPCWEWTACRTKKGYAQLFADGKTTRAHRWSYEHFREPIPDGLELDHLCRVRHCVNPDHLEAVTSGENSRRGETGKGKRTKKSHCWRGHPLSGHNLYVFRDSRQCVTCKKSYDQERYSKMKALSRKEMIDEYYHPNRLRRRTGSRKCGFQHEMRVVDYRAWFCDHPLCGVLVVGFSLLGKCWKMHEGAKCLIFSEWQAKDYLAGKQTLRELVLVRAEKPTKQKAA